MHHRAAHITSHFSNSIFQTRRVAKMWVDCSGYMTPYTPNLQTIVYAAVTVVPCIRHQKHCATPIKRTAGWCICVLCCYVSLLTCHSRYNMITNTGTGTYGGGKDFRSRSTRKSTRHLIIVYMRYTGCYIWWFPCRYTCKKRAIRANMYFSRNKSKLRHAATFLGTNVRLWGTLDVNIKRQQATQLGIEQIHTGGAHTQ